MINKRFLQECPARVSYKNVLLDLWDTFACHLVGHSCMALRLTLAEHSCTTLSHNTFVGHFCGSFWRNTLVNCSWDHFYGALYIAFLWDAPCCKTFLQVTFVGYFHFYRTFLWDTLVAHSCGAFSSDTFVGHSYRILQGRTLAWGTTNVSKRQPSRLQNTRFVRDFR